MQIHTAHLGGDQIGFIQINTNAWNNFGSVKALWHHMVNVDANIRKGIASLMTLVSWEIWSERNARFFRKVSRPRQHFGGWRVPSV